MLLSSPMNAFGFAISFWTRAKMTTRREVLTATLAVTSVATTINRGQAQSAQRTFVLVHGAFHGGWCWRRVADMLQARGHKVFAPTLTGLGERSHLLDAKVNLATHITDVVNVIKWERLSDIILVGHSYGGMVITGVAERMQLAIASIVFLDAQVPENGQSEVDIQIGARRSQILAAQEKGEVAIPPPPASSFRVNEADRPWVDAMCTPHPVSTLTEKVMESGARERIARKTFIRATGSRAPGPDAVLAKYRSAPGWRTYEVPSGHDVMVDMPERLTEILLEVA
jgi:pimeloyl-ACP methyl ester carboxylesterase